MMPSPAHAQYRSHTSVYDQLAPTLGSEAERDALKEQLEASGAPTCSFCLGVPTSKFVKFGTPTEPCRSQELICDDCHASYILSGKSRTSGTKHKCPFGCGMGAPPPRQRLASDLSDDSDDEEAEPSRGEHLCVHPTSGRAKVEDSNINRWASSVRLLCPGRDCGARLPAAQFAAHVQGCDKMLVNECPNECGGAMFPLPKHALAHHLAHGCTHRPVDCLLVEQCGCSWRGPLCARDAHVADPAYATAHLGALGFFIARQAEATKRAADAEVRRADEIKALRTEVRRDLGRLDDKLEDALESAALGAADDDYGGARDEGGAAAPDRRGAGLRPAAGAAGDRAAEAEAHRAGARARGGRAQWGKFRPDSECASRTVDNRRRCRRDHMGLDPDDFDGWVAASRKPTDARYRAPPNPGWRLTWYAKNSGGGAQAAAPPPQDEYDALD